MHSRLLEDRSIDSYFLSGALVSLLVHLLFVAVTYFELSSRGSSSSAAIEPPMMVSFIPPPPKSASDPKRQMVTPPEQSLDKPPAPDAFLSDRDASADKLQIKRGDDPKAGLQPASAAAASAPQQAVNKQASTAPQARRQSNPSPSKANRSTSTLPQLALDEDTLLREFASAKDESSEDRLRAALSGSGAPSETGSMASAQPFSRASGSGAQILGISGSPDYIPSLPDGDITFLNTKANLFAVFVRRVAIQVFNNLRASGWEHLSAADIRGLSSDTVVKAVMSPAGKLVRVSLENSSGSQRFDDVLASAVTHGARDPNPPKEAALPDGNIHFIFKARSWVHSGSSARTGAPQERRWLVLGTGLE